MPAGDQTGPNGLGPQTGRSMGYCRGNNTLGYASGPGRGRGMGMANRFGNGTGGRNRFCRSYPGNFGEGWGNPVETNSPETEKAILKEDIDRLENILKQSKSRLSSLETDTGKPEE